MEHAAFGGRRFGAVLCSLLALALALSGEGCRRAPSAGTSATPSQEQAQEPAPAPAEQPQETAGGPISASVIVKFAEGLEVSSDGARFTVVPGAKATLTADAVTQAQAQLAKRVADANLLQIRRVFQEGGERYVDGRDTLLYYALVLPADADASAADALAASLGQNPLVEEAHRQPVGQPAGLPNVTPP